MKKITKAGIYLSLAAMLALGAGKTVRAYDQDSLLGDYTASTFNYSDEQGVQYLEDTEKPEKCIEVIGFKQYYDKNNKPINTKIVIEDRIGSNIVKTIKKCFEGHKEIEEITMGENVENLYGTFQGCTGLKSIRLSPNISKLPAQAFKGCSSLKAIKIPEKCTEIGINAFEGCTSLNSVCFAKTPQKFKVGKNALKGTAWKKSFQKKKKPVIADGVLLDASTVSGKLTVKGSQVSCIAQNAFYNAGKVTDITLSKVKNVQTHSLDGSRAKKITILQPKKLGDKMFANTKNLKKIVITGNVKITKATMKSLKNPKKVTLYVDKNRVAQLKKTLPCQVRAIKSKKIAKGSVIVSKSQDGKTIEDNQGLVYQLEKNGYYITKFNQKYDESLQSLHSEISIPEEFDKVDVIGVKSQDVFQCCETITSVTMPEDIQLPKAAFMGCSNLKKVSYYAVDAVPLSGGRRLESSLFKDCIRLEEVTLTDEFEDIYDQVFMNCSSLKNMIFPPKMNDIGSYAFYNSGIEKVKLNTTYDVYLPDKAFANCKNLTSIEINKCSGMSSHVFYNCINLDKVTIKAFESKYCKIENNAFENTKWATDYKKRNKPIVINGVLINGAYVKGNVTIDGSKIKQIAGLAFADNKKIKRIRIKNVKTIGVGAFVNSSVTEASISNCKRMEDNLFVGCKKLKKISISNMEKVDNDVIKLIPNLRTVTFGKDVYKIGVNAICYCPNLKTVHFQTKKTLAWYGGVYSLGGRITAGDEPTFPGCKKLRRIYMKSEKISNDIGWAFYDMKKVVVYVPKKLLKKYKDYTNYKMAAQ